MRTIKKKDKIIEKFQHDKELQKRQLEHKEKSKEQLLYEKIQERRAKSNFRL